MIKNYFIPSENFDQIIKENLSNKEIKKMKQIITGWTNIVYELETEEKSYFYRFPRDNFWAKMMVKDCKFGNYIYGKLSAKTPNIKLCYNNDRPFSRHEKIEGIALTQCIDKLDQNQMKNLAKDISTFIKSLANLDKKDMPKDCEVSLLDFLNELATSHFEDISIWDYEYFKDNHLDNYLVHGDLNPGNIIVDKDYHLVAVIDYCFAGIGNPYADVSRVIGRSPESFKPFMIKEYEDTLNEKLDSDKLERFITIWSNIDKAYTDFIRKNNPDIKLPEGLE